MKTSSIVVAALLSHLIVQEASAEEPDSKQPPRLESQVKDRPFDQSKGIAKFLADTEGKQDHDFPAWNDFRQVAGDSPEARGVFAEMLKAEPELCAAVGGDPKKLAELFANRVDALKDSVDQQTNNPSINGRIVDFGFTLPQMVALIFVAARPDVTSLVERDSELTELLYLGPLLKCDKFEFPLPSQKWESFEFRPTKEHYLKWSAPDNRLKILKQIMTQWAVREAHSKFGRPLRSSSSSTSRLAIASWFNLEAAKMPLTLEILHHPGESRGAGVRYAIMHANKLEKKESLGLLEGFLAQAGEVRNDYDRTPPSSPLQERDLALSAIVQINGEKPEDYGFSKSELPAFGLREVENVYLFARNRDRNRGFAKCAKNFAQLGLKQPPPYTPEFTFERAEYGVNPKHRSPDGKISLKIQDDKARSIDVSTGKPIGKELNARDGQNDDAFTFTCWSFSDDGKYVVTGSSFVETFHDRDTRDTDVGRVEVWNAATGERVEQYRGTGGVIEVGFSPDDSMTVLFKARIRSQDKS